MAPALAPDVGDHAVQAVEPRWRAPERRWQRAVGTQQRRGRAAVDPPGGAAGPRLAGPSLIAGIAGRRAALDRLVRDPTQPVGRHVHVADELAPAQHLADEALPAGQGYVELGDLSDHTARVQAVQVEQRGDPGVKEPGRASRHGVLVWPEAFHALPLRPGPEGLGVIAATG